MKTIILLALLSLGLISCNETPIETINQTDIQNREGCIYVEFFLGETKKSYWITHYVDENGFRVLYNEQGFLLAVDLNFITNWIELNYCD